jgi:glycosyltransferase involved in cell wall biosynthesis
MKLVSVIIPCYKDSLTLGRAIESVILQTYSPIEIIVVNDCSPETELIEACLTRYPHVRYLRNPINVGLAKTRNNGLAMANGEIIALLDADDEYHQDKIALQIAALEDNTVVTCGLVYIYPDGRQERSVKSPCEVANTSKLLYRNNLNGAGLLAPKDLILNHGGYDATMRSCEDFDLWLRLLSSGIKVKDIGAPLYLYYFNPAGLSKNIINISKWELEAIRRHTTRMGPEWRNSWSYASVILVWLLRHLWRSELERNEELRLNTIENSHLLDDFPLVRALCRTIGHYRFLLMPLLIVRWRNRLSFSIFK